MKLKGCQQCSQVLSFPAKQITSVMNISQETITKASIIPAIFPLLFLQMSLYDRSKTPPLGITLISFQYFSIQYFYLDLRINTDIQTLCKPLVGLRTP